MGQFLYVFPCKYTIILVKFKDLNLLRLQNNMGCIAIIKFFRNLSA